MYRLSTILASFLLLTGCGKREDLSKVMGMTVYDASGIRSTPYSVDELKMIRSVECDANVARQLMSSAQFTSGNPIWKGTQLGVLSFADGTQRVIAISNYGGFFGFQGQGGYYTFADAEKKTWNAMVAAAARKLHQQDSRPSGG